MKLWVEDGARVLLSCTDSTYPQLVFKDNGPKACPDGASTYADTLGCLEPDDIEAVSEIPGNGFGIGYNSDMREVVGDSVLTSVIITWADAIDYFVETLLNGEQWPTTGDGNSVDYWPGVAEDSSVNLLSDFSSRVAYDNVLDIEGRLASMRQGVSPSVFCGTILSVDGVTTNASAYIDKTTGQSCNISQVEASDSSCCMTDYDMLNNMEYLVEGGFYPAASNTKWGTFDGFEFTPPIVCAVPYYYQGGVCVVDVDQHYLPGWIRAIMVVAPFSVICLVSHTDAAVFK